MANRTLRVRTFRPRGKAAERLNYAESIGMNVSDLINQVLDQDDDLREAIEAWIEVEREEIVSRAKILREALDAPVP